LNQIDIGYDVIDLNPMRKISQEKIILLAESLIEQASFELPVDVLIALADCDRHEKAGAAKTALKTLLHNASIASKKRLPLCQDTGAAVFYVELGNEVVLDEPISQTLELAVINAYKKYFLRASMVSEPLFERKNTGNNSPPIVHLKQVEGSGLLIRFLPKGGGAENKSVVSMLRPADGKKGVVRTVIDAAKAAGGTSCPPWIIGVGIGGSFDTVAEIAKSALFRPLHEPHPDQRYAALENELKTTVEALGIGTLGFGGNRTVLGVHIETRPTHIASLPVAVNFQCHSARSAVGRL